MFPDGLRLLIWDIDGVLFHVRDSYRRAIIDSVQYYFSDLIGLSLKKPLMDAGDTQKFKYITGFNDDWKLTYACVLCFLAELAKDRALPETDDPADLAGMRRALKKLGESVHGWVPETNLGIVTEKIRSCGDGLEGTQLALSELYGADVLAQAGRFWYTDVIKRLFQELYLGEELYKLKYSEDTVFFHGSGFIRDEKALVSADTLEKLGSLFHMGIASGRERFEAEYSLKLHGLDRFFPPDQIISSEEVRHGKPDPESLLLCRKRMMGKYALMADEASAAYVGDSVDDIRASKNAGFYSIGVLSASFNETDQTRLRREFVSLGCDYVVEDAGELINLFS
ncbi:MAG: HAD hydrolase-like protein [Candidatus Altiarchaeia archaeon]